MHAGTCPEVPSSSHHPPINPKLYPIPALHLTHTRTISAPAHLPPPYSTTRAMPSASRSRPELRVITSFPLPATRPTFIRSGVQSSPGAVVTHQPVLSRYAALDYTAPLPAHAGLPAMSHVLAGSHRKPASDHHVHVDLDQHFPLCPQRPDTMRTSSLKKRRNRQAVVISTEMYTSYHPSKGRSLVVEPAAGEAAQELISSSSRPSGRGHRRSISGRCKAFFSSHSPRAPQLQLPGDLQVPHVIEAFERLPIYDDCEIPTYSATYPQPGDPFHLADSLGSSTAVWQPERPYRSPGTASFVVNRDEIQEQEGGRRNGRERSQEEHVRAGFR